MRLERQPGIEIIDRPDRFDWPFFEAWAAEEGWRVPPWELSLYGNELADCAFVGRGRDGTPLGFVTVCRHQCSGWIGNLIVAPHLRGEGVGRRLFRYAAEQLAESGAASLWLTASVAGRSLYEAGGFRAVGSIERWIWQGRGDSTLPLPTSSAGDLQRLARVDEAAWGDSRAGLLNLLARGGRVLTANGTVALLQGGGGLRILGPWLSADLCPRSNRTVLAAAMAACSGGEELAIDLIGGSPIRILLAAVGFNRVGSTVLMVRGEPGTVKFGEIVALASLGSMG